MAEIQTLVVPRIKLLDAHRLPGDTTPVPVLGHLPAGATVVSSFFDPSSGDLHINYRPAPPPQLTAEAQDLMDEAMAHGPGRAMPYVLSDEARVQAPPSLDRITMVAHELIRAWRTATGKGPDMAPWPDLRPHDRIDAVEAVALAARDIQIGSALSPEQARVEFTLRQLVLQAFNLKP